MRSTDSARAELAGAARGIDIGADDPLEMDLHRQFADPIGEAVGHRNDHLSVEEIDAHGAKRGIAEHCRPSKDLAHLSFPLFSISQSLVRLKHFLDELKRVLSRPLQCVRSIECLSD